MLFQFQKSCLHILDVSCVNEIEQGFSQKTACRVSQHISQPRVNLQELHIKGVTRCENAKLTWCREHRADRASSPNKKSPGWPRILTGKPPSLPCDAEGLV